MTPTNQPPPHASNAGTAARHETKRKGGGNDTFTRASLIKHRLGLVKQWDDVEPHALSLSNSSTRREDLRSEALNHRVQTEALIVLESLENEQLFLHLTHRELSLCSRPSTQLRWFHLLKAGGRFTPLPSPGFRGYFSRNGVKKGTLEKNTLDLPPYQPRVITGRQCSFPAVGGKRKQSPPAPVSDPTQWRRSDRAAWPL